MKFRLIDSLFDSALVVSVTWLTVAGAAAVDEPVTAPTALIYAGGGFLVVGAVAIWDRRKR